MKIAEKLLGVVAYAASKQSCYVRVTIKSNNADFNPLAVKATFVGIDRRNLFQGAVVEVARSHNHHAWSYMVTRTFKDVMEVGHTDPVNITQNIHVDDVECFTAGRRHKCGDNPATAKWRTEEVAQVKFFIGKRYYMEKEKRLALERVVHAALSITIAELACITSSGRNLGFWVRCREDQFARFMIYRDQEGLPNGFQDLRVEHVDDNNPRKSDRVAHVSNR